MPVFAVIPTHNRKSILRATLKSLTEQTVRPLIVVGDGGSSDGTAAMIAADFPDVVLCPGSTELWWTGATNLALAEALRRAGPDDHILCINDDLLVRPDYVEKLLACAAASPRRIVGSVTVSVSAPQIICDGGVRVNWWTAGGARLNANRKLSEFPPGHVEPVDVLAGRGALYPVSVFRELGVFPESRLPHYAADYAFSARCGRAGYELVVSYDAVVLSRVELTGMLAPRRRLSIGEACRFFFSRRSAGNLRDRFHYAWLARSNAVQAAAFFLTSVPRLVHRYVKGANGGRF